MNNQVEEWELVVDPTIRPGYAYYVSNTALVDEIKMTGQGLSRRRLAQTPLEKGGYITVTMHTITGRKRKRVHIIVAKAFCSNPDNKPQVDHIDRNTQNNNAWNLRWRDAIEQAANKSPKRNTTKMTEQDVIYVFKMRGVKTAQILAKELGRTTDTISDAWRGADKKKREWRIAYLATNPPNQHLFVR